MKFNGEFSRYALDIPINKGITIEEVEVLEKGVKYQKTNDDGNRPQGKYSVAIPTGKDGIYKSVGFCRVSWMAKKYLCNLSICMQSKNSGL